MFLRKSIFGTASMLGLAGILAFSGCSSDGTSSTGTDTTKGGHELGGLGLGLLLPDGSNVGDPTYTITRSSDPTFSQTGTLVTSGNIASATITGLPAGTDYSVVLTASRTRDAGSAAPCTGSATFSVIADQTTIVNVVLQCDDSSQDTGNVTINGTFNVCPKIGSTSASPSSAPVGSSINLTGAATDKDGDALTYSWIGPNGAFANTANTFLSCSAPGPITVTLSVTDGPTRGCTKTSQPITVTCTAVTDGGTPVVDSGTPVVDSGTPVVDSGTPVVDSGTPVVDSGTPVVDSGTPVVDSGTPVVDSGTPPPAARFGSADCDTCLANSCSLWNGFDPVYTLCTDSSCEQAFGCFQRNHCATSPADTNACYCGVGVDNATCLVSGFVAKGPCANAANTAFGTTNTQTVVGDLYGESTDFGIGGNLFACAAEQCTAQCLQGTYPAYTGP